MRVVRGYEAGRTALERDIQQDWDKAPPSLLEGILRVFDERLTPQEVVARILADVRSRGDSAVREYTRRLDGAIPTSLEVPRELWRRAYDDLPRGLRRSLETLAKRAQAFHQASLPRSWVDYVQGFGEQYTPLSRVGIYIPGGTAVYPSTVLMTAIPARIAGVKEIVLATPSRGDEGPNQTVLAAAHAAGVDRVFQIGGAQAIAAMAYGTESVPRVDMVCGPGNVFVTIAKRMVYGHVAVDGLYGPTETVVIADELADPALCAADLLAQAEHDPLASPIFITTSEAVLARVERQIARQLARLSRREVARAALEAQGVAVIVDTLGEAVALANLYAPEHLCLMVADPWSLLGMVKNTGGVFLGEGSPEAVGDYVAGPSHVMPTGGTARFGSPLGVHHFLKVTAVIGMDEATFASVAGDGARLARSEGFDGHARALDLRRRGKRASRNGRGARAQRRSGASVSD